MKVKRMIASVIKILIAAVVMAFLGLKSYDFFLFTTPEGQSYYALLCFGLTGLGLIAYLIMFMWDADTPLKRTVSIFMIAICGLGEVLTAGFGMQVEAWRSAGYTIDAEGFRAMVWVVQGLGFAHAVALVAYYAGDRFAQAFSDDDRDGIPNAFDRDYRKNGARPQPSGSQAYAQETHAPKEAEKPNPTQRQGRE